MSGEEIGAAIRAEQEHYDREVSGYLPEFLLARYAEEEAVAIATRDSHDPLDWSAEHDLPASGMANSDGPSGYGVVIVDPALVLAECEAKRRIVESARPIAIAGGPRWTAESAAAEEGRMTALEWVLRDLASVYADHPDYRQEWKP